MGMTATQRIPEWNGNRCCGTPAGGNGKRHAGFRRNQDACCGILLLLHLQSVNNVFQIHLHSNERLSTRLQHLGTTPISEGGFTSVKAVIRWGLEECFAVKGWAGCNLHHRAVIYLRSVSISQLATELRLN